jgi:uncharacterized protein YdeI (YjbR/CyaY-like superfamily)
MFEILSFDEIKWEVRALKRLCLRYVGFNKCQSYLNLQPAMISNALYFSKRQNWRKWLEENYDIEDEVWLIYPKKGTGVPRITYNDAVEEALCFGWIDSIVRSIDDKHYMQRFSPRRLGSNYSQSNKERLRWLQKNGKIHPSIEDFVKDILKEKFIFPKDILDKIREDKQAWNNFKNFSPAYRRIRVAYIEQARNRPIEFHKRLENFIHKTRKNKQIGFGGIEKYY